MKEGQIYEHLARALYVQGDYQDAIQYAHESIKIGDEFSSSNLGSCGNDTLALLLLYTGDLSGAHAAAQSARRYDEPENNHNASVVFGVIAIRQNDRAAAQEAFAEAVAQADAILTHSTQYLDALDAKGLALCGLTLCESGNRMPEAIETFKAARAINKDAGNVGRVLKLFDALAVADEAGLLAEVRAAAAGELS